MLIRFTHQEKIDRRIPMLTKGKAIQLLRRRMSEQYPRVSKFVVETKSIRLTHYGFVLAIWNQGKSGITFPTPYRVC